MSTHDQQDTVLITGAAGFIGSAFVRQFLKKTKGSQGRPHLIVLDKLTYAGTLHNLSEIEGQIEFVHGDICDFDKVDSLFKKHQISSVVHFAAESHVDNSITGPKEFIQTNIIGTFNLLEVSRKNWSTWSAEKKEEFRFVHVSTDEVFGTLGATGKFSETTPYAPNSPYSASKASSDMLARAWYHTYGMPTIITNCSNNYGPRQFPEKLIPRMIVNALTDQPLPIYGTGTNIRDWIHVDDHSFGVYLALTKGQVGETYCFGGNSERTNVHVVNEICTILDELKPRRDGKSYSTLITYVEDRMGHDFRYAIDDYKAAQKLGFKRNYSRFEDGLKHTVEWYLTNNQWLNDIQAEKKKV